LRRGGLGEERARRAGVEPPSSDAGRGRGRGAGRGSPEGGAARRGGAGLAGAARARPREGASARAEGEAGLAGRGEGRGLAGGRARPGWGGAGTARRGARATGRGGRAGEEEGEWKEREGEEGEGETHLRGSNSGDHRLQNLGHHGEREVAAREIQMREGEEEGAHGEVGRGARAGPGWVGLGWARPLRGSKPATRTTQSETHDTGSNRESKSETERDEHATSNKEMCFGMMQHP
jgi:hypothetical protein